MIGSARSQVLLAAVFAFTAVFLGALGAHALEDTLAQREMTNAWETAVLYHLTHAVVLLGLGIWSAQRGPSRSRSWAVGLFAGGIFLFSGSIYGLALGGPSVLGPVTPLGGLLLLGGWIAVGWTGWRFRES